MCAEELLLTLDSYLDAAPRLDAEAVNIGPFTVFLARGPWGYYARPRTARIARHAFSPMEVAAVVDAQRAYEQFVAIEWLHDLDPTLGAACSGAGLKVTMRPFLTAHTNDLVEVAVPAKLRLERLGPDHPLLAEHRAVANVAFREGGTEVGAAGTAARDAESVNDASVAWLASRIAAESTIAVAAIHEHDGMVGVGSAHPIFAPGSTRGVAELTGIAVLPAYRRAGVGAALAHALGTAAELAGVELLLLGAQNDDVARVYERVGFQRAATFADAAPRA